MTPYGTVHLVTAFLAIGSGAVVMRLPKGTRWHRTFGHLYGMSMLGVVATSFVMFGLTGSFTPFHLAAIIAGVTLVAGLYTVLARRPRKDWIEAHATWMAWSYVGLMAAFVAESMTRFLMPLAQDFLQGNELWGAFWTAVAVGSFGTMAGGAWLIRKWLPASIAATPEAIRRERHTLRGLDELGADATSGD